MSFYWFIHTTDWYEHTNNAKTDVDGVKIIPYKNLMNVGKGSIWNIALECIENEKQISLTSIALKM